MKHLIRKRNTSKKIDKTKRQGGQKSHGQKIQIMKKKKKKKLKYPPWKTFPILETPKISFLPNTPKNEYWHHLPNRSTLRPSRIPPTGKQVDNSFRHNPRRTKSSEERIP